MGNTWPWASALVSLQGSYECATLNRSQRSTFVCLWGLLRFCSGFNGPNHSSPRTGLRRSQPESLYSHLLTYSTMLDVDRESVSPWLLLSQLIYIRRSDGVSAQSPSLKSRLSHSILLQTTSATFSSVPLLPPLVCLLARSLISSLCCTLIHILPDLHLLPLWPLCAAE